MSSGLFKNVINKKQIKIHIYLIYIIFNNPSARAGYDTRPIFKWSLTGLNSEFPSPRLVASPRLKNPVCPNIYL